MKIANKLFFNPFETEGTGQLRLFHTRRQKEKHYTERKRERWRVAAPEWLLDISILK